MRVSRQKNSAMGAVCFITIMNVEKFKHWLMSKGCEILPTTNDYEALRFKGAQVGVLYKSGRFNSPYVGRAINAYQTNTGWDGAPPKTGRHPGYKKEKFHLLQRDGSKCFFCGKEMGSSLSNMVLAHESCNQLASNLPIYQKVEMALKNRTK